jgi:hypothetical protein
MNDLQKYSHELHRLARKNFPRRSIITNFPNEIWSVDLMDVSNISQDNDNIKFLLVIIDVFSRFAYVIKLKSKKAKDVLDAFKTLSVLPNNICSDDGNEFFNKDLKSYLKQHHVNLYSTHSGLKSVFAERFIRTLKEKLYRYFTEHNTNYYLNVLDDLVNEYNNTKHSSIRAKPIEVLSGEVKPYIKPIDRIGVSQFKVGDYVRISKFKKTFEKGYTPQWSKEVFKVIEVDNSRNPIMYGLEDSMGEKIEGRFYADELQKTNLKDFSVVEKIIGEKTVKGKKMYLVKYDGYSDKFNEYLTKEQLDRIT